MITIREEQSNQSCSNMSSSYFGHLNSSGIEQVIDNIDFSSIIKQVFDLFRVNYIEVDFDADFIMRKLKYVFTEMPPINQ